MAQRLVHVAKGKTLNAADIAANGKYFDSIVFDENTGAIYARGGKFGSIEEATKAIEALKYFGQVSDGSSTLAAPKANSVLKITGGNGVKVTASENGLDVALTPNALATGSTSGTVSWNGEDVKIKDINTAAYKAESYFATATAVQVAQAAADAAQGDATQALSDAADALEEAQKKVASVTGENAIAVTTGTTPKVTLKVDPTQGENVTVTQGTNGLKVAVDLSKYTPTSGIPALAPVQSVKGTANQALVVNPTGGTGNVVLDLKINNTGNVTLAQTASGLSASVNVNEIFKDKVVTGGSLVAGTWDSSRATFTKSDSGSDQALELVIANGSPVYIDVKALVDTTALTKLAGYTKGSDAGTLAATDTINSAFSKLENRVDAAKNAAQDAKDSIPTQYVKSFEGSTEVAEITVDKVGTGNGSVQFGFAGNKLSGTVTGFSDVSTKANSALQNLTKGTDGQYVTTTVGKSGTNGTVGVALTMGNFTGTAGVAETTVVKTYVDSLWEWEEI